MIRPLFAVTALLATLIACDNERQGPKGESFKSTPPKNTGVSRHLTTNIFPFDRVITDKKQRKLETIVVGRTREEVIFQKKNSNTPNKHHRYLISDLAIGDQEFFKSLPRQQWNGGGGAIVDGLVRERQRITALIAEKRKEKSRTPDAKIRNRALDREIGRLEKMLTDTNLGIKEQQAKDSQGD